MRQLSSSATPLLAILLVLMFPIGVLITVEELLRNLSDAAFQWDDYWPTLVYTSVGTFLTYLFLTRVYKVELADSTLHVSRFKTHVQIPLSEVKTVSSTLFFTPDFIWLSLQNRTPLGSTVTFMPPIRSFLVLTRHPLVKELDMLVARAKLVAA
jgi:hypothetical protein